MTTKNQFTAVYKKTKDWVIAWVEEIPGVNTQGKTLAEARQNLNEALLLILEANRDFSRASLKRSPNARRGRISITLPAEWIDGILFVILKKTNVIFSVKEQTTPFFATQKIRKFLLSHATARLIIFYVKRFAVI